MQPRKFGLMTSIFTFANHFIHFVFYEKNLFTMIKSTCLTTFLLLFTALTGFAQITTPAPSPLAKINQAVGLITIDVEYSRPSIKGRKIFGALVPFGDLWRTGANASTKVSFSDKVTVGNISLDKGKYALYTIPGPKEWTIIFYKNITIGGAPQPKDFKEEDVAARFSAPAQSIANTVESFTIELANLQNASADFELSWENTKVVFPIKLDTDSKVMADIQSTMAGPKAGDFYSAARYYYEEKKDMKQALEWVNTSLEKGGDKFWILRLKANIQAELGQYKDAIATANKSTELAKADGNTDYPKMNDASVADWTKKLK